MIFLQNFSINLLNEKVGYLSVLYFLMENILWVLFCCLPYSSTVSCVRYLYLQVKSNEIFIPFKSQKKILQKVDTADILGVDSYFYHLIFYPV